MGGTSTQQQSQDSQSNPWEPAINPLKGIIGQLGGQVGSTGINGNENAALLQLNANANAGVPGGLDHSGIAKDAYSTFQGQMTPFANGSMVGQNSGLTKYLDTIGSDVTNRLSAMYAGAGRDPVGSGGFAQNVGRGVAEGTAPVIAQQYNNDIANQMGAANSLYGAGGSTAGLLSGLDSQRFANEGAAAASRDMPANQLLAVEAMRRGMPIQNIGQIASLLGPLAGLGGTSTGQSQGSNTMSGAQQAWGWMNAGSNMINAFKPGGMPKPPGV